MSIDRLTRVNALMRREIGEALFHVIDEDGFDLSAVTITEVHVSRNLREGHVHVSIRSDAAGRARMLAILRQHRVEIQQLINRDLELKYTPRLTFELDLSVEKGDHVLDVLAHLDALHPSAEGAMEPGPEPFRADADTVNGEADEAEADSEADDAGGEREQ